MPIAVSVRLPTSKDPREAVRECIRLIRSNAVGLEGIQIELGLFCMTNSGVLERLAERLPSEALGFMPVGSDRAVTAREFQTEAASSMTGFQGILTDYLLPADAFALIEQLLESPAQAIRSTAFHVTVRKVRWKGAPEDGMGSLSLFDMKGLKRAQRFSFSAGLQLPGEDPKSRDVRTAVEQVARATSIPFAEGTTVRVRGEKGRSPGFAKSLLVGQICFEEAIEDLAAKLPKRWVSEFAPNALAPNDAFERRCQQWGDEAGGKVNLPSLIRRVAKKTLPEFKFESADAEQIIFSKQLGQDSALMILVERAMPRIGKAFTLTLGVRAVAELMRFTANVFQIERTTEERLWTYSAELEAEAAVNESMGLVKELLPRLESSLRRYFEPWPEQVHVEIEQQGSLTAREAFAKAEPLARSLYSDAALIRLANRARSLEMRDIEGPRTGC
ncbi:MAG: hypothetical protein C5B50_19925 [Verrucomicrobia bacterium]|nr:MAG: hypothetical protein C5B50_19925 [Verrucomicrobiota bacterium]